MAAPDSPVNLDEKFRLFEDLWSPKTVGQVNDLHLKLVKVQGEFVWHSHADTDEFFLVRSGSLTIEMRGRPEVRLGPGDFYVVPLGVEHRPVSPDGCELVLLEPIGVVNTGDDAVSDLTAAEEWI